MRLQGIKWNLKQYQMSGGEQWQWGVDRQEIPLQPRSTVEALSRSY